MWSIFKSRADGGFNPCFFKYARQIRSFPQGSPVSAPERSNTEVQSSGWTVAFTSSAFTGSFSKSFAISTKSREKANDSADSDAISLLLPARECNKKALPQHVTLSSIGQESWCCKWCGNGMIVNPWLYLWIWCFLSLLSSWRFFCGTCLVCHEKHLEQTGNDVAGCWLPQN